MHINPYPTSKFDSAFTSAAYTQVHFRLDFIMNAYIMDPDRTALLGAV